MAFKPRPNEKNMTKDPKEEDVKTQDDSGFHRKSISINNFELETLKKGNMVSDAVINASFRYFYNEIDHVNIGFTNTFFYKKLERDGVKAVSEWIQLKGKIDTYSHYLIPIAMYVHWFLVDLDFNNRMINIYDSLRSHPSRDKVVKNIRQFLEYNGIKYRMKVRYPPGPKQCNSVDCGIYVIRFALCIFLHQTVVLDFFNKTSIFTYRKELFNILQEYSTDNEDKQASNSRKKDEDASDSDVVEIPLTK